MNPKNACRWRFSCPCGQQTTIDSILLYKDGDIELVGVCAACEHPVKVETSIDEFLDTMGKIEDEPNMSDDSFLRSFHIAPMEEKHETD